MNPGEGGTQLRTKSSEFLSYVHLLLFNPKELACPNTSGGDEVFTLNLRSNFTTVSAKSILSRRPTNRLISGWLSVPM